MGTILRIYITLSRKRENQFLRLQEVTEEDHIFERKDDCGDARDRIGFIKYLSRKRTISGVSLFECRICESKRESIGNDWKRLNKAQVKTVIRKVDGP